MPAHVVVLAKQPHELKHFDGVRARGEGALRLLLECKPGSRAVVAVLVKRGQFGLSDILEGFFRSNLLDSQPQPPAQCPDKANRRAVIRGNV